MKASMLLPRSPPQGAAATGWGGLGGSVEPAATTRWGGLGPTVEMPFGHIDDRRRIDDGGCSQAAPRPVAAGLPRGQTAPTVRVARSDHTQLPPQLFLAHLHGLPALIECGAHVLGEVPGPLRHVGTHAFG